MKWIKWTTRRKKGKKVTNKRLKEKDPFFKSCWTGI